MNDCHIVREPIPAELHWPAICPIVPGVWVYTWLWQPPSSQSLCKKGHYLQCSFGFLTCFPSSSTYRGYYILWHHYRGYSFVPSMVNQPMTHICVMSSHKPIRIYMGGLILGVNTLYMLLCFFKLFPMLGKGLNWPWGLLYSDLQTDSRHHVRQFDIPCTWLNLNYLEVNITIRWSGTTMNGWLELFHETLNVCRLVSITLLTYVFVCAQNITIYPTAWDLLHWKCMELQCNMGPYWTVRIALFLRVWIFHVNTCLV